MPCILTAGLMDAIIAGQSNLRGGVKFPTGGTARERFALIR